MDERKKELIREYKQRPLQGGVCIIRNTVNGKYLLEIGLNPKGNQNRFAFSCSTGSCVHYKLQKDWDACGKDAFTFEILDEIEQKETQTPEEFKADIEALGELWLEKLGPSLSY